MQTSPFLKSALVACAWFIFLAISARESCEAAGDVMENESLGDGCFLVDEPKTLFRWSSDPFVEDEADEEDVIVTDRPDFTEASSTVGKGRLQIETGYTLTIDRAGSSEFRQHSYPETLFRIGLLAEWLEFRIAYTFLNEETKSPTAGRQRVRGSDDLYLGAKISLTPQSGWLPEMALLPQMLVPSGGAAFTSDEILPGVNWIYSWEVNDCVSVGGSTQVNRVRDASGHIYAETAQSGAIGVTLTDQLGIYGEYFGMYPGGAVAAGVGAMHFLNGGFSYLVNNDMQLDVRAGFGLNDNADDFFTGAGVSVRF